MSVYQDIIAKRSLEQKTNKEEFIKLFNEFFSNIELEYVDIYGQTQKVYFDKLLKTTDILLADLPFDSIDKMFKTEVEFWGITKEYWRKVTVTFNSLTKNTSGWYIIDYNYANEFYNEKPSIDTKITYKSVNYYGGVSALNSIKSTSIAVKSTTTSVLVIKNQVGLTKEYDKMYVKNTYLKYNDYLFFKKYFNLDITNIDIYYPVKMTNKTDFKLFKDIFNVSVINEKTITTSNNDNIKLENNDITYIDTKTLQRCDGCIYHNTYYNFYTNCSLFNAVKYFIYGLLLFKQDETNNYSNISLEKTEILKTDENIDKTVSQSMINRIEYDTINEQELIEELQPIPTDDMYANEQHIIIQGIFEDIQKFCNNIEKYIAGANWEFDKINYDEFKTIDEKINYLENILNTYKKQKLDLRGYNSYFKAQKLDIKVGDSDKLNFLNLTETENNFLHIEKMLQDNKYPLFAKINLINQIRQTILIYLNTIKNLADNKRFYDEYQTEIHLPQLRDNYDKLAKAVASQEQPLSFGNPSYDGNPNEEPFRKEQP